MNTTLLIKGAIGALIVILIQLLAASKNYFVAALVPLFPFFGLIAYYIVGTQRGVNDLRTTLIFGMFSLIPYLTFLITLYFGVTRFKLGETLVMSSLAWAVVSTVLIVSWRVFSH